MEGGQLVSNTASKAEIGAKHERFYSLRKAVTDFFEKLFCMDGFRNLLVNNRTNEKSVGEYGKKSPLNNRLTYLGKILY